MKTEIEEPEADTFGISGPMPEDLTPPDKGFTRFNFKPKGVSEAEFRSKATSGAWQQATPDEEAEMSAILDRFRPQVAEVRFDEYGPLQSMSMDDAIYVELGNFRQRRFRRINAALKRKRSEEMMED